MPSDLSILFFGTQMALGGAQKLLLDQARWFHAQGNRVTAAFFYDKQGLGASWRKGLGFPLLTLTEIGSTGGILAKAIGLVAGLFRLWSLLRRGRFDVIETFTYDSNLLALPLAWMAGVPVRIATHHGTIEGFPSWVERLHSWLINVGVASVLVSVSNKTSEQAVRAGIKPEHIIAIPNGIPPMGPAALDRGKRRGELGLADTDVMLLSVGRLVYQKGHEFLVRAMPGVLSQVPGVKVMICGDGPLRAELEAEIARLQLTASVSLQGNQSEITRFLDSADIFVLPSRWEGLPVALLEAMGSGLPVVATHVEGVEEVVQDQVHGFLVPPEDPAALEQALLKLVPRTELRDKMGRAARKRIEESYTIDIMCERYRSVMVDLLRARRLREATRQSGDS
jgi:glycosyltransferase involved in cell wall biosynthesis